MQLPEHPMGPVALSSWLGTSEQSLFQLLRGMRPLDAEAGAPTPGAPYGRQELARSGALELTLIPGHPGFLLAILPPGAFIGLGLLIAGRNWLDSALAGRKPGCIR